jgi:hypothetical protein
MVVTDLFGAPADEFGCRSPAVLMRYRGVFTIRRAISLIGTRSSRCNRRISTLSVTLLTSSS